ncbi:LOW QUALITY PROTEIN: 2-carboxy-1,4-naphthoquinone phytyltransferase, chloroplastic [Amborella trichopoda]|uniref:LOW QUALITY PROTEIN: 2-carboxy-1,4-naphthoquinone phytyltransferase, chloroplastic n=1 Tax=Amborella trichopoda TaxID=13333 RepID=UPI0009BD611B|nr:LOW QUALITY PROTEIN: 2-carboxy-1,4-naphthoquinone phytyltransferase, chloroplastic [Amborella trichopoda]|eukprot:XP_020518394.1 LOW QUALITY PROTEIN: 2-carboxy-1,4-naphthoquinone phytyltransferase, chloroplastic [Amborella trichopoda]
MKEGATIGKRLSEFNPVAAQFRSLKVMFDEEVLHFLLLSSLPLSSDTLNKQRAKSKNNNVEASTVADGEEGVTFTVAFEQLDDFGFIVTFGSGSWKISQGSMTILKRQKDGTLYILHGTTQRNDVIEQIVAMTDEYSGKCWLYPLTFEDQVFDVFKAKLMLHIEKYASLPSQKKTKRGGLLGGGWLLFLVELQNLMDCPVVSTCKIVGGAAAYLLTGFFAARRYLVLLLASASIITWLNLSNDVYDYDTGADKDKKESVVNIFGSRGMTLYAAFALLASGFVGLVFASIEAGSISRIMLLTGAIMCGYAYQCPPFRLGYLGLGEPLCFIPFAPLATTAFYLSQSNKSVTVLLPLNGTVLSAAILVGISTSLILFCSHFHQIEGVLAVGKMSPLVRIGTEKGSKVVKFSILTLYSFLFVLGALRSLPLKCVVLCTLTLPIGKLVVDYVQDNHNVSTKIFMAKYYCVRLHALFGIALAIGLAMARRMAHFLMKRCKWAMTEKEKLEEKEKQCECKEK